jgi:hypothetical protein
MVGLFRSLRPFAFAGASVLLGLDQQSDSRGDLRIEFIKPEMPPLAPPFLGALAAVFGLLGAILRIDNRRASGHGSSPRDPEASSLTRNFGLTAGRDSHVSGRGAPFVGRVRFYAECLVRWVIKVHPRAARRAVGEERHCIRPRGAFRDWQPRAQPARRMALQADAIRRSEGFESAVQVRPLDEAVAQEHDIGPGAVRVGDSFPTGWVWAVGTHSDAVPRSPLVAPLSMAAAAMITFGRGVVDGLGHRTYSAGKRHCALTGRMPASTSMYSQ